MSALDVSHLSGPDAVVALRSFGRRFRTAVLPVPDDDDAIELAERIGPSGISPHDRITAAANDLVLFGQALRRLLVESDPVLPAAVTDPAERDWGPSPGGLGVVEALDRLADEAGALADAADRIETPEWSRSAAVAGGGSTTALDLVRTAVSDTSDALHAVQADLQALRAR
jgi:hypothetical protein